MKSFFNSHARAALFFLLASASAHGSDFFAVTSSGELRKFDTATPGAAGTTLTITGFGLGESVIGIDIRPLDQKLYALTKDGSNGGRLYTVDTVSGAATLVVPLTPNAIDMAPYTSLSGTRFAFGFNPVADRIRLVFDNGQNFRINPITGVVLHDTDLNPGTPHVVAVGYTNSFRGAVATTLYDIDTNSDMLLLQNPPNAGNVITVGALGVDMVDLVAFDISVVGTTNLAYATALVGGSINLYSIDLVTGAATLIGGLNGNFQAVGIAIVSEHIFANGFE
jgi:Domain of unknown function (DUF4394)